MKACSLRCIEEASIRETVYGFELADIDQRRGEPDRCEYSRGVLDPSSRSQRPRLENKFLRVSERGDRIHWGAGSALDGDRCHCQ